MERTLYLSERYGMRVSRDGPSLWVTQAGHAGRRVPARLIRRVLVVGNVALDAGCLTLFAERGVPVLLLNHRAEAVATVLGMTEDDGVRQVRQEALAEDRDRRERALAWLAAWERGRQLVLVARVDRDQATRWRREGLRRSDYEAWVAAHVRQRALPFRVRDFFRGALFELIAAEVTASGWGPHVGIQHRGEPLGWIKDCAQVLRSEADRLWLVPDARSARVAEGWGTEALAARFEAGRPRIEALLRRMLEQFGALLWRG